MIDAIKRLDRKHLLWKIRLQAPVGCPPKRFRYLYTCRSGTLLTAEQEEVLQKMLVYPSREFGMRPRKSPKDIFRKQNYWAQGKEPTPWYVWDSKLPVNRSKSEERPAAVKTAQREEDGPSGFSNDLRDYLMTSTLHGLRYIGERKLTWFERFFWLTAFGCSLVSAGFFILNIYAKWRSSPMIVSINPENMPLSSLPFPALTVCNVNQAKKTVAERYWAYGNPVDRKLLQSLCSTKDDSEIFEDGIAGRADWDHTRSFLINVTQPCSEMLAQCIWDSSVMNCEDLFNAQLTDEGLCCTFNVVHRNKMFRNPRSLNDLNITFPSPAVDWTPEDGYPVDAPPDGFPWRPKGIGTHHGLTLVLDANIAEYYCASTKSAGFKILLHNPTETPKIRNLGAIYGPGREARIAIWPRISDAQPSLRSIDIKKRLCLFSSEKELVFFRTYTLKNCEMECEAQAMLEVCKCVYYYMPKNKSTRICGKADAKCYTNMSLIMPEGWENMLVVHFYFEENTFMRFTKGEIFGLTEFLCGLLGLCMGFSMMSAVELLYYLTLRALCLMRRRPHTQPFVK
ncbi:hypothetical protein HF086_006057 [Spodoptera exigua]|uniref:Uncharacterized protein n=1 Tax=Spodoptera exigua TaxID=7107 RepID=A0A922MQJ6_SPOEX|nr:hypothetical protein HF086_006057 [Spodoptera exigua]